HHLALGERDRRREARAYRVQLDPARGEAGPLLVAGPGTQREHPLTGLQAGVVQAQRRVRRAGGDVHRPGERARGRALREPPGRRPGEQRRAGRADAAVHVEVVQLDGRGAGRGGVQREPAVAGAVAAVHAANAPAAGAGRRHPVDGDARVHAVERGAQQLQDVVAAGAVDGDRDADVAVLDHQILAVDLRVAELAVVDDLQADAAAAEEHALQHDRRLAAVGAWVAHAHRDVARVLHAHVHQLADDTRVVVQGRVVV